MSEVRYGWMLFEGVGVLPLIAKEGYFGLTATDITELKHDKLRAVSFDIAQEEGKA